jgi:tRNA (cmo5U34)-methyltransferase
MIDSNRFAVMAEAYDLAAPYFVPRYDAMQEDLVAILPFDPGQELLFLDLGAGSGRLLERLLQRFPQGRAIWLDSSVPFMERARIRLMPFADRVEFRLGPIEESPEPADRGRFDAIVSSNAIHHCDSAGKKALFGRCLDALKPGGWFANLDETRTEDKGAYLDDMLLWVRHTEEARDGLPASVAAAYETMFAHFEKWKERNIGGIDAPKAPGDDIHESAFAQAAWLGASGFERCGVYSKYRLWAVMAGRKPITA